jgi:hypothetical protein
MVSRRLPTATARVRYQIMSHEICSEQSSVGAGFLQALWFPPPILIPPTALYLLIIVTSTVCSLTTESVDE